MIKGNIKLPDKGKRAFPDRLGSLVAGFEDSNDEIEGSDWEFELGEELEPITQTHGSGSDRECDAHEQNNDEKTEQKVRQRPGKGTVTPSPDSVLKAIVVDEKRSDFEHELSQKEINLEKLQRIASTGIPNGGTLRATTWKVPLTSLFQICTREKECLKSEEAAKVRTTMNDLKLIKERGSSWIEVDNEVHYFVASGRYHPDIKEIYANLDLLRDDINWSCKNRNALQLL